MLNKKHVVLCFFSSCLVVTLFMNVTASQNNEPYDYMSTNAMVDALDARVHMQPQKGYITAPQQHSRQVASFRNITTLETSFVTGLVPIVMLLHARRVHRKNPVYFVNFLRFLLNLFLHLTLQK